MDCKDVGISQANSDWTRNTPGRSARQAAALNEGCDEWLGEEGQEEQEDLMEMGEVKELVEVGRDKCCVQNLGEMYHVSGSRCTHNWTNHGGFDLRGI